MLRQNVSTIINANFILYTQPCQNITELWFVPLHHCNIFANITKCYSTGTVFHCTILISILAVKMIKWCRQSRPNNKYHFIKFSVARPDNILALNSLSNSTTIIIIFSNFRVHHGNISKPLFGQLTARTKRTKLQ